MNKIIFILLAVFLSCKTTPPNQNPHLISEKENFHLYLLIGQSNMAGRGKVSAEDTVGHKRVFMLNKENQWVRAKEPLHFDKPERIGTGLGLVFGKSMAEKDPDVTIGLIPCAVGGTAIEMWKPGGFYNSTGVHPYNDAIMRAQVALEAGTLKGVLWHQGESDSNPKLVSFYEKRLRELAQRIRTTLKSPEVPFIVGGLGEFYVGRNHSAGQINEILSRAPSYIDYCGFVSAVGLGHKGDSVHFSEEAYRELGSRYATKLVELSNK